MTILSDNIRTARTAAGLSQGEVAKRLDVKQATVSAWEVGRNEPDIDALAKMASIFNTTIDALAGLPLKIDGISSEAADLIRQFEDLTPEDKKAVLTVIAAIRGKYQPLSKRVGSAPSSVS